MRMTMLTGMAAAMVAGLMARDVAAETFSTPRLFEVTASKLNVRSSPSTSARIVKVLDRHQAIWVIAKTTNWKQIKSPVAGWVHEDFVRFGLKRFVTASSLNVRTSPSTSASAKKVLKKGAEVRVIDKKGDWRRIDKPTTGWVHGKYLSSQKPGSGGGSVNVGSTNSHGFAQLPRGGKGFYWYCSISTHHWGTPRLIAKTITMGQRTVQTFGCGDMSLPYGTYFPPHSTHRDGRAEDLSTMGSYSNNQRFINLMYSTPTRIAFILFNGGNRGVQWASGHYDHMHMAVY